MCIYSLSQSVSQSVSHLITRSLIHWGEQANVPEPVSWLLHQRSRNCHSCQHGCQHVMPLAVGQALHDAQRQFHSSKSRCWMLRQQGVPVLHRTHRPAHTAASLGRCMSTAAQQTLWDAAIVLFQVQRCTLLSIKTGGCPENCSYCSQSSHWSDETGLKAEKLMDLEPVYEVRRGWVVHCSACSC